MEGIKTRMKESVTGKIPMETASPIVLEGLLSKPMMRVKVFVLAAGLNATKTPVINANFLVLVRDKKTKSVSGSGAWSSPVSLPVSNRISSITIASLDPSNR